MPTMEKYKRIYNALTLLSVGAGIVVYALAWIIMPRK